MSFPLLKPNTITSQITCLKRPFFRKVFKFALTLLFSLGATDAIAIHAVVMHNIFFSPDESKKPLLNPYVEVYWQINAETIRYKQEKEIWLGKVRTDVTVSNEKGIVNEEHYILSTLPIKEKNLVFKQKIVDLQRFQVGTGKFILQITLTDLLNENNKFTYKDSFTVDALNSTPSISDIQLVDTSFASSEQNTFQRNDKVQIPLCANFLDDSRKTLMYYAEVYNTHLMKEQQPLIGKVFISKKEFEKAHSSPSRTDTLSPALLQIAEGSLSVGALSSGNYYLNIIIEGKNSLQIVSKSLFFQLLNTKPVEQPVLPLTGDSNSTSPIYLDLNKTFLSKYSFAQVRAILKMLLPIALPNERSRINDFITLPDEMYSRYFVYNFWLARNKLNPEQEWKEYSEKVKEINKLFGSSRLPGYETERGTIYLKYGKPNERITVENEQGSLPYEIWQYNSLAKTTNAVLLFYRPGFISNDYKLLHTTINGEVRNRNWRSELYSGGTGTPSNNSRAEQYIGNR